MLAFPGIGLAAIAVIASSPKVVNSTATTSIILQRPTAAASGNLLVAQFALNGGNASVVAPAGWSVVASVTSLSNPKIYAFSHVVGLSDPASYTFTWSTAVANGGAITAYSGVDTTTPLDAPVSTATGAAATSGALPGVVATTAGAHLVGGMAVNSSTTTSTPPSGMTEHWEAGGKSNALSSGALAATGNTGTRTWTFSTSRAWAGYLAALRPAAGAQSPPSVSSFTPTSGPTGTSVTISGSNLTGATSVKFNGVSASFTLVSGSSISATVPATATTGPISVTTPSGTAASTTNFTVSTTSSSPTIVSFTPTGGSSGTSVTLTGTNLTGASAVKFNGATSVYSVNSSTTITATVPTTATTGPISVTTSNGTATSSANFTISAGSDTTAPTVSITSPANGGTVSGTVAVNIIATDETAMLQTELWVDGVWKGDDKSLPYAFSLNSTTLSGGSHTIEARALDTTRNVGRATIQVTVNNVGGDTTPPTVSITSPANGASVSNTITVAMNASDNVGVQRTELWVDGIWKGDDTTYPYSLSLDTKTLSNGTHGLQAKARDAAGNIGSSSAVSISVSNTTAAPTVASFSPASGAVGTSVSVTGTNFTGTSAVKFNGTAAAYTVTSSTAIQTSVPTGASTGTISITTPSGTATSASSFTVTTSSGDPVLVAAGDIACPGVCFQDDTANLIDGGGNGGGINPTAVLGLGDFQYDTATSTNLANYYTPYWGRFKSKTYITNGGSHDFYGLDNFQTYWNSGGPQSYAGGQPHSFNVGNWHIVSLNSYCWGSRTPGCDPTSATTWLRNDLAQNSRPCTIAMIHEPYWTSPSNHGRETRSAPWIRELYAANAEILLQGHNHGYERFQPMDPDSVVDTARGIVAFTVGTGGRSLYTYTGTDSKSVVKQNSTYGVLKLVLHSNSADVDFVQVPGQPAFQDHTTVSCH